MQTFLIAARTLHFAAAISLCGVFAWECLLAGPAFTRGGEAAITPRLRRRLGWLSWASLALALISGAFWLAAVAAEMSGKPLGAALAQGVWTVVLTRTRFGADWLLRLGLAALLAFCLMVRQRRRAATPGAVGWTGLLLAALLLASLAWTGHGAATAGRPGDVHLAADLFHLLAAGLWLGTLLPLALFLAEARRAGDPGWAALGRTVTRRFALLAAASVAVLLASGLINTWFLAGTVPAVVGTDYGRLLLAKLALFLAMLMIAAANRLRLTPRLGDPAAGAGHALWRTTLWLQRNALSEATIALAVLAIVGTLGTLPPGSHSEPLWPFPFRVELAALTAGAQILLAVLGAVICLAAIAAVAAAAGGRHRRMAVFAGGLVLCLGAGWLPLRPALVPAYPTSFYTPAEPYAAASIVRGAALYAWNCALCHGRGGRGDDPAAAGLRVRPADLNEPHLLAHRPGDLFWWVSHGMEDGAMPGFAGVLTARQRWDVINFIRARAAGILARRSGPQIATEAAPEIPDFAFTAAGAQQTLGRTLASGPVLLVLFAPPAPMARLAELAGAQQRLARAGLSLLAIEIGPPAREAEHGNAPLPPFVVAVSPEVGSALALFRAPADGGETELMLDRGGNLRARWSAGGPQGLPDAATLLADAERVARLGLAAASHEGHAH